MKSLIALYVSSKNGGRGIGWDLEVGNLSPFAIALGSRAFVHIAIDNRTSASKAFNKTLLIL